VDIHIKLPQKYKTAYDCNSACCSYENKQNIATWIVNLVKYGKEKVDEKA